PSTKSGESPMPGVRPLAYVGSSVSEDPTIVVNGPFGSALTLTNLRRSGVHRRNQPMHTRQDEPSILIPATAVLRPLTRSWRLMLLRGLASILFGIAAFVWPGLTVLALTLLYGAFAMVDGILSLGAAIAGRGDRSIPTWWLVVIGLLGIAAGIVA